MLQIVNHSGKFMRQLTENQKSSLEAMGKFCLDKMNELVPVDTGELKSNNSYVINRNELFLMNTTHYALFVEKGTSKMVAQPFMGPSARNYTNDLKRISAQYMAKGMRGK